MKCLGFVLLLYYMQNRSWQTFEGLSRIVPVLEASKCKNIILKGTAVLKFGVIDVVEG